MFLLSVHRAGSGAPGLRPPCLLRLMPGLGAEAPPPSLRVPARSLPPSSPPQPAPVSAAWAPHCRCQSLSRSSAALPDPLDSGELRLCARGSPGSLAGLDSPSPACGVVRSSSSSSSRSEHQGTGAPGWRTALSDAAGQTDRLPASRRAMPEAPGRRRRGHHPEQCAQEAQLHLADRAPAALHLGAG